MHNPSTEQHRSRFWTHPVFQPAVGVLTVLVLGLVHQVFVSRAHPDALYMDSLRLLAQLDQWEAGKLSTLDFWGQGSSHRGFVNQLFLLANVALFNLDVLLVNRLTGLVTGVVALILAMAWWRDTEGRTGTGTGTASEAWLVAGTSVAIALLCHGWAGFELFTLDLGLPLWVKNLCFVAFFSLHAHLLGNRCQRRVLLTAVLSIAAPGIVLVVGMGWNYAFICALLALQILAFIPTWRTPGRWYGVLPCAIVLAAFVVYLKSGTVTDAAVKSGGLSLTSDSPLIWLYAIGSSIGNPQAIMQRLPMGMIAVAGAGIVLAGLVSTLSWLQRGALGSRLPVYLLAYGALVAVSVTLARGADGPGGVMASRYYMDLVLGLIGVLWITIRELQARAPGRLGQFVGGGILCAVLVSSLQTARFEWGAAPFRAAAFVEMNRALLQAVPDENDAALLQSPISHARQGADVMRERQLSVFEGHPELKCSGRDVEFGSGWHAPEAQGRWAKTEATLLLPMKCACDVSADLYVPEIFYARRVEIWQDGSMRGQAVLPPGRNTSIPVGRAGSGSVTLHYMPEPSAARAPASIRDEPELGALLTGFSLHCALPSR